MKTAAKNLFFDKLQTALNYYLSLDPESAARLSALTGKVVAVELLATGLTIQLSFTPDGILLLRGDKIAADTHIKGTPLRLLHMALTRQHRQTFFADDVSIEGNLEYGQSVINLFDHLEIDWEELLSRFMGDVSAHHIGRLTNQFKSWAILAKQAIRQDVSEYLQEEIQYFPPREALKDFYHDVDCVRMDTDRLEVRMKQLEKTLATKRGQS